MSLVADGARREAFGLQAERLTGQVLRDHLDPGRPLDLVVDPRERETAFEVGLAPLAADDLRIDQDVELFRVLAHRDVDHGEP